MLGLQVLSTSKIYRPTVTFWARIGIQRLRSFSNCPQTICGVLTPFLCNHHGHQILASQQTEDASCTKMRRSFSRLRVIKRSLSSSTQKSPPGQNLIDAKDENIGAILQRSMTVIPDFLSEDEETSLFDEVERYMKRLRYEFDHWDNAIHGFRETERKSWNSANQVILERVKALVFPAGVSPLAYVHVLDISKEGYIKPHVDAVRFCGDTIAGMCLLSSCVMRLALEKDSSLYGDVHLPQRCLYIMKGEARYDFTHEVLKEEESKFKGQVVPRDRRISVICRNQPNAEDTK